MASKTAVLLLGHGSHIDAGSSGPIHDAAARLRRSSPDREVRVAFWKEEPSLRNAFLLIESPRVVAVPMFTSEGYFTNRVLPRELGIEPPLSEADGLSVRYTRPVGTHPMMASVVLERARSLQPEDEGDPGSTTLVILGHGTERHRASGDVVRRLTEQLSDIPGFASVQCAFLDEEPRIVSVLEAVETPRAVVVPFFIAEGWHVGQTIPRDLGLDRGRAVIEGTEVVYADPVGTHPALDVVIEQIVEDAEAEGWGPHTDGEGTHHPSAATEARAAFVEWIDGGGPDGRVFLQTRARRSGADRYEIRHARDTGRDPADLDRSPDPLRALEIARWNESGSYRPLTTAPDLARGWLIEGLAASDLWEAYASLYPGAAVHWYLGNRSRIRPTSFREAAARQTGIYAPVKQLTDTQVSRVSSSRCGPNGCLRRVVWPLTDGEGSLESPPDPVPRDEVPCPEPCSLFFTEARELIDLERAGVLRSADGAD